MNFNQNQEMNDYDCNDDLMDDDMAYTPSAATEDGTLIHMQRTTSNVSAQQKNEYDLDMDDTEETKEDPTVGISSVPIENYRQASKSLGVEMMDAETQ